MSSAAVTITPLLDEQPLSTDELAVAAAAMRLQEARRAGNTFAAVREILSDLVGCEGFGVFSLESRASVFALKAGSGAALARPQIPVRPGAVRQSGALAALPLRREGELAGALMLFSLLPRKEALDAIDQAVLSLVASEAGADLLDAAGEAGLN